MTRRRAGGARGLSERKPHPFIFFLPHLEGLLVADRRMGSPYQQPFRLQRHRREDITTLTNRGCRCAPRTRDEDGRPFEQPERQGGNYLGLIRVLRLATRSPPRPGDQRGARRRRSRPRARTSQAVRTMEPSERRWNPEAPGQYFPASGSKPSVAGERGCAAGDHREAPAAPGGEAGEDLWFIGGDEGQTGAVLEMGARCR